MQAYDLQRKTDDLIACGPLKAWSVIVTVLGDLCQRRGDRIAGRDLTALTARMRLTPATLRVALHRLRRDGWIESERRGRDAAYRLSDMGWNETQAVRGRIYGTTPVPGGPVHLLIAPPQISGAELATAVPDGGVMVTPRTALLAGPLPDLPDRIWASRIDPGAAPGWLQDTIAPPELRADYARLAAAAADLLLGPVPTDAADAAALRLLALHHFRRLCLRHGDLPDMLLGDKWEGATARRAVMQVLERFGRPAPDQLSA